MDKGPNEVGEKINVETDEVGEQSEDNALDIQFDDSEEEIRLEVKDKKASGSMPKKKRGRLFKQAEASGSNSNVNVDDGDIVNEDDQSTKVNYKGLGDSNDYNSDEIQSGCDSEDEDDVDKEKFPTFKLLHNMKDYKWELGTYFQSKEEFQQGMRTYAVHSNMNLKFKKNDAERMRVVCRKGCT
ncbi:hypothetical protein A2U01_0026284 [Trifolium medium]|uniref:Transposase MuDR plant domain-containing protein n=1 Tax=Trifolium medium TaxID=97028 RepID=A0A392P0J9_9FABA|nr:hypothetical protein [Trifolium medium]